MAEESEPWVEEALHRDFNTALLDTLGAIVCVLDGEGRIVHTNRAGERVSGYSVAELRRGPFWELLIPSDEVEKVRRVVRDLVELRLPNECENHWITRSGARRCIRWSNTVLREGDRFAWIIGTGIDVTDARRAEEECARLLAEERRARAHAELAEQRAAFLAAVAPELAGALVDDAGVPRALVRHAVPFLADWCVARLVDDDGTIRISALAHADPDKEALLERLGPLAAPASAVLLPPVASGRPMLVNGAAGCAEILAEVYARLPSVQQGPLREAVRVAGMTSLMVVPLFARGRFLGSMIFVSARADRTYGADDLVLAQALAVRAALAVDNARLYQNAQQALQAREDFLVVASHELRTPLMSLQIAVQGLMAHAARSGGPPWGATLLASVERSTGRLAGLVEDVLDIARWSSGTLVPSLEACDLRAVVVEAVEASSASLRRAGCEPRLDARGPTSGSWDRRWLRQIVAQLLANAMKYGAGRPIEIGLDGSATRVRLTVRDHGIGVSADEQARIFERFERAVSVRHYGGLGLGLWLVRRMVEALGGAVSVESRPGEGASFTVDLPATAERAPARPAEGAGA